MASPGKRHCANCIGALSFPTIVSFSDATQQNGVVYMRCVVVSGGQTGEWALVQEEQMGPLLTPGKISLNLNRDNKH